MKEVSNTVFVITKKDIKRSGARLIPELFYMVPGMQVRMMNGHQFAGFHPWVSIPVHQ